MSLSEKEIADVGTGVFVLKKFLAADKTSEIMAEVSQLTQWVPSPSGIFKENTLVEHEYVTKSGVLTVKDPKIKSWRNTRDWHSLQHVVQEKWKISLSGFSHFGISRYEEGATVDDHQDTGPFSTTRVITFIVYLNEDFLGGEIVFPRLGAKYKPCRGDLLVFLSEHIHRVETVRQNKRYCIIWFGEVEMDFAKKTH
jgi:Rps23 Pro-64 3,4-dihydroxylase Tpa1-like proline 4-hydroxylase